MIEFISQLPTEYQEVAYIQSSGTQFIDTGFVPNDNTEITLVFTNNNATTGNYDCIFGTRTNASNDNTFALWIDHNRCFGAFYGTGQSITLFPTSINATAKHTATMKGRVAEIDGISITCSATSSSPAYSFYIGACNTAGTADYFSKILIYESKIYDNVTLVRDFVPCYRKSDNVAGMYDLVNGVFYSNAGTGDFAKGENSNAHGDVIITPGGIISMQCALRRRMMRGGKKMWTVEVKQLKDRYGDSPYTPIINGVASDIGVYQVEDGEIIKLRGFSFAYDCVIYVNDACVGKPTRPSTTVTYSYTVRSNCTIEIGRVRVGRGDYITDLTTQ